MFDWSIYRGNLKWLPGRTIYITRHGSHAYGTNTAESDLDLRGIAIAPKEYYLGFLERFEQTAQQSDPDFVIFNLQKFIKLATDSNPNCLELLFTEPEDHLLVAPVMRKLLDNRDLFISKLITFRLASYAFSQLKRINLHVRFLRNPLTGPPKRSDFGLPERTVIPADQLQAAESSIKKVLDKWNWHDLDDLEPALREHIKNSFTERLLEITQWSWKEIEDKTWTCAANSLGYDTNFIHLLDLERRYHAKQKDWEHYQEWQKNRNPKRAALEAKYEFDTKHASHLYRLFVMCREVLTTGKLIVKRPDAEQILAIRNGAWTYEQLIEFAEKEDKELNELMKTSSLPREPDRQKINQLCIELIEDFNKGLK